MYAELNEPDVVFFSSPDRGPHRPPGCGLGAELVVLVPALFAVTSRSKRQKKAA